MFVISVKEFLALKHMLPHQALLRRGLLTAFNPELLGRILFVSHEWLSAAKPDPSSGQLECLQVALRRLMSGEVDVESFWIQQLVFGQNLSSTILSQVDDRPTSAMTMIDGPVPFFYCWGLGKLAQKKEL